MLQRAGASWRHLLGDVTRFAGGVDVARDGRLGLEMQIALDTKSELAAEVLQFADAHRADFRKAHAKIAKANGDVGIFGIELDAESARSRDPRSTRKKTPKRSTAMVSAKELAARGVPHSTMQSWIRGGVLKRPERRGIYRKTRATDARVAEYVKERGKR